jgi:predicted glycoside hydrolase/deacetylase ChbG (UPF0249 family)
VTEYGNFYATAAENLAKASAEEMEREMNAQYDWMVKRGLVPEHADSHMGTVYGLKGPSHLAAALRLCSAHGLHFRLPGRYIKNSPPDLREAAEQAVEQAKTLGVGYPDELFTHEHRVNEGDTYEGFKYIYLSMLERCPEGVSEMFLHPCAETPELKAINSQWQKRVWEYAFLRDEDVYKFIQREGIKLSTYAEAPFSSLK